MTGAVLRPRWRGAAVLLAGGHPGGEGGRAASRPGRGLQGQRGAVALGYVALTAGGGPWHVFGTLRVGVGGGQDPAGEMQSPRPINGPRYRISAMLLVWRLRGVASCVLCPRTKAWG